MRLDKPQSERVQNLRALAITAVVAIHCCPVGLPQVFVRPLVNFCVVLFIFLSGCLTKTSYPDLRAFCRRRLSRVLPPYAIWTCLYTIADHHNLAGGSVALSIGRNLLTGEASAQMYFVPVYVQLVLLTPLFGRVLRSRASWAPFALSPLSVLLAVYLPLTAGTPLPEALAVVWHECCLGWLCFYMLGLAFGNGFVRPCLGTVWLAVLYCATLGLQVAGGLWFLSLGSKNCGTQLKLSSLASSSLLCLLAWRYLGRGDRFGIVC